MADTALESGDAGRGALTPSPWEATRRELWRPPQSVLVLYLLSVVTLGVWLCRWVAVVSDELRRNGRVSREPWVYVIALPVPILGMRLTRALVQAIHVLDASQAVDGNRSPLAVTVAFRAILLVYLVALLAFFSDSMTSLHPGYWAFGSLLLLPLPVLGLQARLNRFKEGLAEVAFLKEPRRLGWATLALTVVMIGLALRAVSASPWLLTYNLNRWMGDTLVASVPIRGESGFYALTPPDGNWVRVDRNHIYEGSDLSLYGPGLETKIVVWTACNGESVEERVDFRRDELKEALERLRIEERRELLTDPFVPVSYAYYRGTWHGAPLLSVVATIAQGNALVEVYGETMFVGGAKDSLEAMVRSLRVEGEAMSCTAS